MKRGLTSVMPRSRAAGFLLAAALVTAIAVAGNSVGEVFASGVRVANTTGSAVTVADDQANIAKCVAGIDKAEIKTSNDKVKRVDVDTRRDNSCTGVSLQVVVLDDRGGLSTGTIANLERGEDKFKVDVTGTASKRRNPQVYVNIYG